MDESDDLYSDFFNSEYGKAEVIDEDEYDLTFSNLSLTICKATACSSDDILFKNDANISVAECKSK